MNKKIIALMVLILAVTASWRAIEKKAAQPAQLLVARFDLPKGTALNADLIDIKSFPRAEVEVGSYEVLSRTDLKVIDGMELTLGLSKGGQVTRDILQPAVKKPVVPNPPDSKGQSEVRYLEGVYQYGRGNFEKARGEFAEAVRLDPSNVEAEKELKHVEQRLSSGR